MKSPNNIQTFLDEVDTIRQQRGKAINLLFQEIYMEINEKSKFLQEQSNKIEEMIRNYHTLVDKINVF